MMALEGQLKGGYKEKWPLAGLSSRMQPNLQEKLKGYVIFEVPNLIITVKTISNSVETKYFNNQMLQLSVYWFILQLI